MASLPPIGVYVHFPWCLKKCPYCDFVSFGVSPELIDHEGYADAVIAELGRRADALSNRELATVFFGGGTPSLWRAQSLGRVLAAILKMGRKTASDVEITVECNPTSLDFERARALVDVGVNRVSIGVQGLDTERLRFLGRLHDAEGGLTAVCEALRAKVPRVSADLMYGVATGDTDAQRQSAEQAAEEARRVAETGVTHLSAYSLTIEPGTQFGELARKGRLPLAVDDVVSDAFFAIEAALGEEGFGHYEISNYARPGEEARHNLGYWNGDDYLGLGCAAYGTVSAGDDEARGERWAKRYRNLVQPVKYVSAAMSGDNLEESAEPLEPETRLKERIMLGLRLERGFDLGAAASDLGVPPWSEMRRKAAEKLRDRGRLEIDGDRLRVPSAARVFTDGIAAELF